MLSNDRPLNVSELYQQRLGFYVQVFVEFLGMNKVCKVSTEKIFLLFNVNVASYYFGTLWIKCWEGI